MYLKLNCINFTNNFATNALKNRRNYGDLSSIENNIYRSVPRTKFFQKKTERLSFTNKEN